MAALVLVDRARHGERLARFALLPAALFAASTIDDLEQMAHATIHVEVEALLEGAASTAVKVDVAVVQQAAEVRDRMLKTAPTRAEAEYPYAFALPTPPGDPVTRPWIRGRASLRRGEPAKNEAVSESERAARKARAMARRTAVHLRKMRLGDEEQDENPTRGTDALSLVTQLTLACWAIRGESCPPLDRRAIPIRFVPSDRSGEAP